MILQGNQRGGASDLATHLLKAENEHIDVHELRGFVAGDLKGALNEAYAVSKGTKAKQFLYSLSLNPPANENVSTSDFEDAINRVEKKLGLDGQPRAIVFHEKHGRRHAHAVWSRTNTETMTAVHLPHTKKKLQEVSRDLYIAHGWEMPQGFINSANRDPKNFTLAQWQQAKRIGKDPRHIKQAFQDSWALCDGQKAFANALKERGFILAKGDRRGFVALDHKCEVYAVAKWVGVKSKDVKAKLGDESVLPSVSDTKIQIAKDMQAQIEYLQSDQARKVQERIFKLANEQRLMTSAHKAERHNMATNQNARWVKETIARQARFRKGIRGVWDRLTGRHNQIKKANEAEALMNQKRDVAEKDQLIFAQLEQRRRLELRVKRLQDYTKPHQLDLSRDINDYQKIEAGKQQVFEQRSAPKRGDPKLEM